MALMELPAYFAKNPTDNATCTNRAQLRPHAPDHARQDYASKFEKERQMFYVRIQGQDAFDSSHRMLQAELAVFGLAWVPSDVAQAYVDAGSLYRVLEDWMPRFLGYNIHCADWLQNSPALAFVVGALRHPPLQKT